MTKLLFLFFLSFFLFSFFSFAQQCDAFHIHYNVSSFNGSLAQIEYASSDGMDIYLRTRNGNVYRSTDGGFYWEPQMDLMENFYNSEYVYQGYGRFTGVVYLKKGATDGLMFLVGGGYIYWITRGDGLYKSYELKPNLLNSLLPHPTNDSLVLRKTLIDSCNSVRCNSLLEVSEGQGIDNSWRAIRENVYSISWGNDQQIYFIGLHDNVTTEDFSRVPFSEKYFYVSEDLGATTSTQAGPGIFEFLFTDNVIYAVKYSSDTTRDIFISYDFGSSYTQAHFSGIVAEAHQDSNHYMILDSSEGISFVALCSKTDNMIADLYQSDLQDGQYWLTLPHQRANCSENKSDFIKILGLNGIYLSNAYNLTYYDSTGIEKFIQTGITFDKGGKWSHLSPVSQSCSETPDCNLHLFSNSDHSVSDTIQSRSDAIGLILATGNEGVYRQSIQQANTYLSRNGGFTWEEIKSGSTYFSMAPRGDMLISTDLNRSNNIVWSWDQGLSWNSCQYSNEFFHPYGISYLSTNSSSRKFVIYGRTTTEDKNAIVAVFDFDNGLPRSCVGFDSPDEPSSDYETFTPATNGGCLLGQRISYVRRKRDVSCWSEHDETSSIVGVCECTRQDYTCDGECWAESLNDNGEVVCLNICVGLPNDPEQPPEGCTGTYMKSQGYRLVPGDQCEGGLDLGPIEISCIPSSSSTPSAMPSPIPSQSSQVSQNVNQSNPSNPGWAVIVGSMLLLVLIILAILILVLIVLFKTNTRVRGLLRNYLPTSLGGGDDSKLYSVLGDGESENSLFSDDIFTENNEVPRNRNSPGVELSPLVDLDDDDDNEGALDLAF